MPTPFFVILGISSTLLGLYITIISVVNPQTTADYHIGCYLSTDPNTIHSIDLRSRLNKLTLRDNHNRDTHALIQSSPLIDSQLHTKSVAFAQHVNNYVHSLATANSYQRSNMQFYTQLSKTRQQYTTCVEQLTQIINVQQNQHLWQAYNQCFIKYNKQKTLIQKLYADRRRLLQQIQGLMVYDHNANRQFDLDAELKKIKKRYDNQNIRNDKNKQDLIIELKKLQHKTQLKSTQLDEIERNYNRTKIEFQICMKNLKQFRKCEDIAKALRQYGYVQTVQSLQDRIKSKRDMLVKLRQHVLQNRQAGGDNKVISQMYSKRQKQLIQTIKLRLQMGYDEMKQCGCTEVLRKKLQQEYEQTKMKLNVNRKELNELQHQSSVYEKRIKQTDKMRQQLINEFREDTQRLKNRQTTNILTLQQKLAVLKQQLKSVNSQLSDYSPRLNKIQFQCNQYKDRLRMRLKDGERVSDCLARRKLYEGLRDKGKVIIKGEVSGLGYSKDIMLRVLESVVYPERLVLAVAEYDDDELVVAVTDGGDHYNNNQDNINAYADNQQQPQYDEQQQEYQQNTQQISVHQQKLSQTVIIQTTQQVQVKIQHQQQYQQQYQQQQPQFQQQLQQQQDLAHQQQYQQQQYQQQQQQQQQQYQQQQQLNQDVNEHQEHQEQQQKQQQEDQQQYVIEVDLFDDDEQQQEQEQQQQEGQQLL